MNRPQALHRYAPRHRGPRDSKAHRLAALARCVPLAATAGLGTLVPATAATATTRAADTSGALAIGSAGYAVPAGAVFASPSGSDSSTGTLAKPVRTIARAIALAPAGGTVVLRGGTYHESLAIYKKVTIQNYPKEAAWMDGTVPVTGWTASGNAWAHKGWTTRFDASVGYNKGDKDGTAPGWQFVNPSYPMAAHPDQVYLNGTQLRQVASRSKVVAGTFFLDTATSILYVGSNPTGQAMRAATLSHAMSIRAAGVVVRGIGVRRYAPSIWHVGAVTVEQPSARIENVSIVDSATIGLGVIASDVVVNRTTIQRAGMLGLHIATADRFQLLSSRVDNNDWERFNPAPVAGGIKASRTRGVLIKNSSVSYNAGHGYWSDVSIYDTKLINNNFVKNKATGIFLEISARGTIVNNLVDGNGAEGIKVNNISTVDIYNNTVVRNARPINIVQDPRTPANTSYGHDYRYNEPEMTWLVGPVTVRNNVIGLPNSKANCVLCVEDYTYKRTAAQMGVTSNGNVFNRVNAGDPDWLTVWSRGTAINPGIYGTLPAHRSGTGQDKSSLAYDGFYAVSSTGHLSGAAQAKAGTVAVGLPSSLATLSGQTAGAKWLGVWGR